MAVWHIQLLGGLRATHGADVLAQFPSRPVAMLMARLALEPRRRHAREELIEILWPGVELDVGRNRLRQALATLRRLVEPPGMPPDSVLVADRQTVGLAEDAVSCDVHEFERFLKQGAVAEALACYRGDLLPGYLDEWVEDERSRLSALNARALLRESAAIERAPMRQAVALPARAAPPAPRAAGGAVFQSLPAYVSAFFGREDDRRLALDALGAHRLVTLTGLGGFGKTRLAVEVARNAEGFDTVAFVALSECNDAALIADRIRGALRMDATQEDALTQIAAFLEGEEVLLVLDNFEQLADDGAAVVLALMERLPRLRCLVTSRRVLDVPGEAALPVAPLALPRASMSAAEAVATPSLALFIDRARGARADFALTADNRGALIALCRALEGLPLAIEIAASRIRSYSPREMCEALAERFDLLTRPGQRGSRYGRHASLQAAIEWSWNLLSAEQQRFFAGLSVFRGGFTAQAVEAVCSVRDARGQLDALVADSLVRVEAGEAEGSRFSMLDTLREFGAERLGDDAAKLRARHRAHFLAFARDRGGSDPPALAREFANLKQALATALEDGKPACAVDLGVALRAHWEAHGTLPDELELLAKAVEDCAPTEAARHAGIDLVAQLALSAGDVERALGYAQRAVSEAGGDRICRARALTSLAHVTWERDQRGGEVVPLLDEALALATAAGAADIEADALRVKAAVAQKHGAEDADYVVADALLARAEALYLETGQQRRAYRIALARAGGLAGLGRYDEARAMLARCEQYFAQLDSAADLIAVANIAGYVASLQERWPEAVAAGRRGVQLAWERHAHLSLAVALGNLPQALVMLGEFESAAQLMAFAACFWQRIVGPPSADDAASVKDVRKRVAKRLGAVRAAALWAQGEALTLAQAVALAMASGTATWRADAEER